MKKSMLALAVVAITYSPLNVFAQDAAYVEKLEKRLMALEQKIYNQSAATAPVTAAPSTQSKVMLADFEGRLQNLEEESSKVYGAVEELGNTVRQFAEKMEMISKDFDLRLQDLEAASVANSGATAPHAPQQQAAHGDEHASPVSAKAATQAGQSEKFTDRISARGAAAKVVDHGDEAASSVAPSMPAPATPAKVVENKDEADFPESMTAQEHYDAAYKLIVATKYEQAEKAMNLFIERYSDSALLDNAYYWLGEVYLVQNMPEKAVITFSKGLAKFPKGVKAAGNLLKMGVAFKQMGKADFAKSSWSKLLSDYPTSAEADKAKKELEKL